MSETVETIDSPDCEDGSSVGTATWRVSGLDCPDCARTVDVSISRIDGVLSASLNFASSVLLVEYSCKQDPALEIESMLKGMGYGAERLVERAGSSATTRHIGTATAPVRASTPVPTPGVVRGYPHVWVSGILIVVGWAAGLLVTDALPERIAPLILALPYAASIVVGGRIIFRRALSSLRARLLDMNVLMTIAVVGAALIGEWSEAAAVVFLFSVGGALEARSLERTRGSIRELMQLTPEVAHVVRGGEELDLAPADVTPGERIVVRPGERIPLDGTIAGGSSAVDEGAITGESVPLDKSVGDEVFAGTLNTYGVLEILVTAQWGDSTLSRVIFLVEEAQAQRAPFQTLVDRFTRYYTPAVTGLAVAIATVPPLLGLTPLAASLPFETAFGPWFYRALVLLVVSCPCALVISTPVAIVSAITRASRDGVLVKGGAFLEIGPRVRAIAFDKTGTLTCGKPDVVDVVALDGRSASEVLEIAAALEASSTHPLARAVLRAAGDRADRSRVVLQDVRETPGRGVSATLDGVGAAIGSAGFLGELGYQADGSQREVERFEGDGHTVLAVGVDGAVVGLVGVSDQPRESAPDTVSALREQGIDSVSMLTGDNERVAGAIAQKVGLDSFSARLLPEDKVDAVRDLKEKWGVVAMVGDGVNDAPALALADLGIAMGAAGSDTALETADVALMSDDLDALPGFFALSRRTVAVIRQNVFASIAIKLLVLVAAVFGYAPLWLAVFADTGVALLVIVNSLRLLRGRKVGTALPGVEYST